MRLFDRVKWAIDTMTRYGYRFTLLLWVCAYPLPPKGPVTMLLVLGGILFLYAWFFLHIGRVRIMNAGRKPEVKNGTD